MSGLSLALPNPCNRYSHGARNIIYFDAYTNRSSTHPFIAFEKYCIRWKAKHEQYNGWGNNCILHKFVMKLLVYIFSKKKKVKLYIWSKVWIYIEMFLKTFVFLLFRPTHALSLLVVFLPRHKFLKNINPLTKYLNRCRVE